MAATTGGAAETTMGRMEDETTTDLATMEVATTGLPTGGKKRCGDDADQESGTFDARVRKQVVMKEGEAAASAVAMEGAEEVGSVATGSMDQSRNGGAVDGGIDPCGTFDVGQDQDVLVRQKSVKEFWCIREPGVFPKAAAAAKAVRHEVLEAWGSCQQLKGFPCEVLAFDKSKGKETAPVATGMVKVCRAAFDGWQSAGWDRLVKKAWPVAAGIEHCSWVKAFGSNFEHARELNWLMGTLAKFLENGNILSMDPNLISFGYAELPPRTARLNGSEWCGYVYGVNLPLQDLIAVVGWGAEKDKETKSSLRSELMLDADRKNVVSSFIAPGEAGHKFHPAEFIAGSFTVLIESRLTMVDFDLESYEEVIGMDILCDLFGEQVVLDISPSVGGLMGTKIVRVRVKCGLKFEKQARAQANALVMETSEANKVKRFVNGTDTYDLKFFSEEAARALADQAEGRLSTGGARGTSTARVELSEVSSALLELKEVQAKTSLQMALLAEEQKQAVVANAKQIEGLAEQQAKAAEGTAARFESTQAQLSKLAELQARAAEENAKRMQEVADAQKQSFMYSNLIQTQLAESMAKISALGYSNKSSKAHPELVLNENIPPDRSVLLSVACELPHTGGTMCQSLRHAKPYDAIRSDELSQCSIAMLAQSLDDIAEEARAVKCTGQFDCKGNVSAMPGGEPLQVSEYQEEGTVPSYFHDRANRGNGEDGWTGVKKGKVAIRADSRVTVSSVQACGWKLSKLTRGGCRRAVWETSGMSKRWSTIVCLLCLLGRVQLVEGVGSGLRCEGVASLVPSNEAGNEIFRADSRCEWGFCGGRPPGLGFKSSVVASSHRGVPELTAGSSARTWDDPANDGRMVQEEGGASKESSVEILGHGSSVTRGGTRAAGLRTTELRYGSGGEGPPLVRLVATARTLFSCVLRGVFDAIPHAGHMGVSTRGVISWRRSEEAGAWSGESPCQGEICCGCGQLGGGQSSSARRWRSPKSPNATRHSQEVWLARGPSGYRGGDSLWRPAQENIEGSPGGYREGLAWAEKYDSARWLSEGDLRCGQTAGRGAVCSPRKDGSDSEGHSTQGQSDTSVMRDSRMHSYSEPILCAGKSGVHREGLLQGSCAVSARMGHLIGRSDSMRIAARAYRSLGSAGSCSDGASSPFQDGSAPDRADLPARGNEEVESHQIRVVVFRDRRVCCCSGLLVRRRMEVPYGGGDCEFDEKSVARGVGGKAGVLCSRCIRACGARTSGKATWAGGLAVRKLEMRTVVIGEHHSPSVCRKTRESDARCRGNPGDDACGGLGFSDSHPHRVRSGNPGSQIPYVLGMDFRLPSWAARLVMVLAAGGSSSVFRGFMAEEKAMGSGDPTRRLKYGSPLWEWWGSLGVLLSGLKLMVASRRCCRLVVRDQDCKEEASQATEISSLRSDHLPRRRERLPSDGEGRKCSGGGESSSGARPVGGGERSGLGGRLDGDDAVAEDGRHDSRDDGEKGPGAEQEAVSRSVRDERSVHGVVLCWNARQLSMPVRQRGCTRRHVMDAAGWLGIKGAYKDKIEFLGEQMDRLAPWMVALMEVDDSYGRMRALGAWFRRRGYEMVHLPGEGSSKGGGGRENGIVLAASKDVQIMESRRIAFRTLAVSAVHKSSKQPINVAVMHGASTDGAGGDDDEDGSWSFSRQLDAAVDWCRQREGVLMADANRIPCRQWRMPSSPALSKGDKVLRKASGWSCECCPAVEEDTLHDAGELVGSQRDDSGRIQWTRWGPKRDTASSQARLDVAIAFGVSRNRWREASVVRPSEQISDHALIVYGLALEMCAGPEGERRPLPVKLGPMVEGSDILARESPWHWMSTLASQEDTLLELRKAVDQAGVQRVSKVEALVPLIRALGEKAVERANIHKERRRGRRFHGGRDDRSDLRMWAQRLSLAQDISLGKRRMDFNDWLVLFHPCTGMRRFCARFSPVAEEGVVWHKYIQRCRRQWERTAWGIERRNRAEDAKLANLCHRIDSATGGLESAAHIHTIWRMLSGRRGSDRMRKLREGDRKEGRIISMSDDDFLAEAGRIGESFVASLDRGYCDEAFKAWLDMFCGRGEGRSGTEDTWNVEKEFSFGTFCGILRAMRGKAVGAGGLSVELLIAAGQEVQWLFYEAIIDDTRSGRFAAGWKRVLYVLLRKPSPNDPDIVSQRREIALMPQDLKILLQGIRRATFAKIGERLSPAQFGWRQGYGCAEPSLALGAVLQQARRLRHWVFVLYIDLAQFFPAINRNAACRCEEHAGLPRCVADIVSAIYGSAQSPQDAVRCQYETEAGLGAEFRNHMGRLMGCPLSPDSAKIMLNSIILALKTSVTGVALWPFEGEEMLQAAYADDWVGLFDDVEQLRKAWDLWVIWAEIVGAKLGIKGLLKTVISSAWTECDVAGATVNPRLRTADGQEVPFLEADQLYKHLGVPRAANADGKIAWTGGKGVVGIRDKLMACVARVGKLRRRTTSQEQFMCISNVLLGGMANAYLQATPITFEEAEEVERKWRRSFCRFSRRDLTAPSAELYAPAAGWSKGRVHVYSTGTAALYTSVEKAMADSIASPAREAVRSAVALSMYCWGCRSDPNLWSWGHLEEELRSSLRGKENRYVGDAWMLATIEMEKWRNPMESEIFRDEELRVRRWGRWRGLRVEEGVFNPLLSGAGPFQSSSPALFEPREFGGLGLAPRPELLRRGIAELQDLCSNAIRGSGCEGRWVRDRKVAAERVGGLGMSATAWRAWEATVEDAAMKGCLPAFRGRCLGGRMLTYQQYRRTDGDRECRRRLLSSLRRAKAQEHAAGPAEVWAARLRKSFTPRREEETRQGVAASGRNGHDTIVGLRLHGDGQEEFLGTEGGAGEEMDEVRQGADWRERAMQLQGKVRFSNDIGWPCRPKSSEGLEDEEFVDALEPALQLAVRARLYLGDEATVLSRGWGGKVPGWRVALDVQKSNWGTLCELQARFEFQYAFAVDASSGGEVDDRGLPVRDEWGWQVRVTTAAAARHDGRTMGGRLDPSLPSNNYMGELVALVTALRSVPSNSRVLLVFDAQSPVKAWRKFRRKCTRAKWAYQAAPYLAELDELVRDQQVVFFLWQSSHCGAPANEMADMEAERIRRDENAEILVEKEPSDLFAMWPARPSGALFGWAKTAMNRVVVNRLVERSSWVSLQAEEDDWALGGWSESEGIILTAMSRATLMARGDSGHKDDRHGERRQARARCPLGCKEGCSSWMHYAFACEHQELRALRAWWVDWTIHNRHRFDGIGLHRQVEAVLGLCRAAGRESDGRNINSAQLAQRLLAGWVEKTAPGDGGSAGRAGQAVQEMIRGGIAVLGRAVELEEDARRGVVQSILDNRRRARALRLWKGRCAKVGPVKAAALFQVRFWRQVAHKVAAIRMGEGSFSRSEAMQFLEDFRSKVSGAVRAIRSEAMEVIADPCTAWFCAWRLFRAVAKKPKRPIEVRSGVAKVDELRELLAVVWPEVSSLRWHWQARTVHLTGVCARTGSGIRVPLQIPGLRERWYHAFVSWLRLGGFSALRRARKQCAAAARCRALAQRRQEMERARVRLLNFCNGRACSGGLIPVVHESERVTIEVGARKRSRTPDGRWARGLKADKRGRWAIAGIIMIRGREPEEKGWDALVDWVGPFEPSWVAERDLCGPARTEARQIAREFYSPEEDAPWWAELLEGSPAPAAPPMPGWRKSPRLSAGVAASEVGDEDERTRVPTLRIRRGKRTRGCEAGAEVPIAGANCNVIR